jgi:hypothetical protein
MLRACRRRNDRIGYAVTSRLPALEAASGTEVAHAYADKLAAGRDALAAIYRAGES